MADRPASARSALRRSPRASLKAVPHRQFSARLPTWLLDTLAAQAARHRLTSNALLIEYLAKALDPLNADVRDAAISERLRAIEESLRGLESIAWRQRVTLEAVGVLAKAVLGYMREATTSDERRAVHAQGERRFAIYAERVSEWADGREQGLAALLEEALERAVGAAQKAPIDGAPPLKVAP